MMHADYPADTALQVFHNSRFAGFLSGIGMSCCIQYAAAVSDHHRASFPTHSRHRSGLLDNRQNPLLYSGTPENLGWRSETPD